MSFVNNIIKAAVSIFDLQQCLGSQSQDLGTLCRLDAINKWAKFKPVNLKTSSVPQRQVIDTIDELDMSASDRSQWKWLTSSTWWRGTNGMCGLSMYQYENLAELLSDCFSPHPLGYQTKWQWGHDALDTNHAARLQDFVGYRHNAIPPLHDFMSEKATYFADGALADGHVTISAGYNVQDFSLGASLSLADLGNGGYFSDWYFGVVVLDSLESTSFVGVKTTSVKVGANGFIPSIEIPIGSGGLPTASAQYKALGFLTPVRMTSFTDQEHAGALTAENVYSIGLRHTTFNIAGENEWINVEFQNVDAYTQNPLTGRLRFYTNRVTGQGNYGGGQYVRVYLAKLEGRFGSSGPGIDPPQIGEPTIDYPPGDGTTQYIDIPCRASASASPSYKEIAFSLPNESDQGANDCPLRRLEASAVVYHSGVNPDGTWNNTSGTKEEASDDRQLRDTNTSN